MPMPNLCQNCMTRTAEPTDPERRCARCIPIIEDERRKVAKAPPASMASLYWIGCDRCPARAGVCYVNRTLSGVLAFCGHHAVEFDGELVRQGFQQV